MSSQLVAAIRGVRFRPVRLRTGYDMGDVDSLLERLEDAAREGLGLGVLCDAPLSQVRLLEGYDMSDVDEFLTRVRAGDLVASGDTASAVHEKRGLRHRLFRNRR